MPPIPKKVTMRLGAAALLFAIFGVPALVIPLTMKDVPARSEIKTLTNYQEAINIVQRTFEKHNKAHDNRRLMPLPVNSTQWIKLINPMGRKAPGGGFAILDQASINTGAIGLSGNDTEVTITLPAYRTLNEDFRVLSLNSPDK